jgi:FkbM family methyltransferase
VNGCGALTVKDRVLDLYAILFARPIFRRLNLFFLQMGFRGIGILNARTPYLSGETIVARKIIKSLDSSNEVVIDVGANEGDFTDLILSDSRNLSILSFEPHPRTYSRLQHRFADTQRVKLLNCAVGSETGEISLFDYDNDDGSFHASVFRDVIEVTHQGKAAEYRVKIITLDSLNIDGNVGLIKIDVEGFELAVLKGAKKLIAAKRPKFFVIEFNEMNVNSHTFLKDICAELTGYRVERILPGGRTLELNNYRAWKHEIFAFQNLLFTKMDQGSQRMSEF